MSLSITAGSGRRVERVEINKLATKYRVVGYGPGRTPIFSERGDLVKIHSGTETTIRGAFMTIEVVSTTGGKLDVKPEIVAQTGAKIIHINPGGRL